MLLGYINVMFQSGAPSEEIGFDHLICVIRPAPRGQ